MTVKYDSVESQTLAAWALHSLASMVSLITRGDYYVIFTSQFAFCIRFLTCHEMVMESLQIEHFARC